MPLPLSPHESTEKDIKRASPKVKPASNIHSSMKPIRNANSQRQINQDYHHLEASKNLLSSYAFFPPWF